MQTTDFYVFEGLLAFQLGNDLGREGLKRNDNDLLNQAGKDLDQGDALIKRARTALP